MAEFVPISIEDYVEKACRLDHKRSSRKLTAALQKTYQSRMNVTCEVCGNPIWVIGSAECGWNGCFQCIVGEVQPDGDYEIVEDPDVA